MVLQLFISVHLVFSISVDHSDIIMHPSARKAMPGPACIWGQSRNITNHWMIFDSDFPSTRWSLWSVNAIIFWIWSLIKQHMISLSGSGFVIGDLTIYAGICAQAALLAIEHGVRQRRAYLLVTEHSSRGLLLIWYKKNHIIMLRVIHIKVHYLLFWVVLHAEFSQRVAWEKVSTAECHKYKRMKAT